MRLFTIFQSMLKNSSFCSSYEFIKVLGTGCYSVVHLVNRIKDNKLFAMKQVSLDKLSFTEKKAALTQIRLLASIISPYIIAYEDSFYATEANSICILMEYADGGDLQAYIKNIDRAECQGNGGLKQEFIWKVTIQILNGLKLLHDSNIVHRDLKSSNIYLSDKQAKLADFNVSKISDSEMMKSKTGTPYYTAPQIWKGEPYTKTCDIWSLGCIIYEMCALRPPFKSQNIPQLFLNIVKGKYNTLPFYYSEDLRNLVRMCLTVQPEERPSCTELLAHPTVVKRKKILWNKNWQKNSINLIKPLKCPKVNSFLNDELEKVPKRTEVDTNKKMINLKKYRVETQGQSSQRLRKQLPIKFRKRNLQLKNKQNSNMEYVEDEQPVLQSPIRRSNKKKLIFRSVKQIDLEEEKSYEKPITKNFRLRSCKKLLYEGEGHFQYP